MAKKLKNSKDRFLKDILLDLILYFSIGLLCSILLQMLFGENWVLYVVLNILFAGLITYFKNENAIIVMAMKEYPEQENNPGTEKKNSNFQDKKLRLAGMKYVRNIKKNRDRLFDDIIYNFTIYFLIAILVSFLAQIVKSGHLMLYLFGSLIFAVVTTYFNKAAEIAKIAQMKYICKNCGSRNRNEAYHCSECGSPLEKNFERIMRVYTGNNIVGTFVLQVLKDSGIIAWKQTYWKGSFFLPTYVYVFEENSEEAIEIVSKIDGKTYGPTNFLDMAENWEKKYM